MVQKIILLVSVLTYSIIVSQSFMYILALKNMQLSLDGSTYTVVRKLIDSSMRDNFKYAVYGALIANLALVGITARNPGGLLFICSAIAFLALVADTVIMLKGNLPVNDLINSWSTDSIPQNWPEIRVKWFHYYHYRQVANIIGFCSLLTGAIFGK